MDCCGNRVASESTLSGCQICGNAGRIVAKQTVVHQVKTEKLASVGNAEYRFCSSADCDAVYYSADGNLFTTDDVREIVTSKTRGDDRPLCYCFGFTEGYIRREISRTGESNVPSQISQFINEKLCACEVRNPSGVCCLGEVNKTVKRLTVQVRVPRSQLLV